MRSASGQFVYRHMVTVCSLLYVVVWMWCAVLGFTRRWLHLRLRSTTGAILVTFSVAGSSIIIVTIMLIMLIMITWLNQRHEYLHIHKHTANGIHMSSLFRSCLHYVNHCLSCCIVSQLPENWYEMQKMWESRVIFHYKHSVSAYVYILLSYCHW